MKSVKREIVFIIRRG